MHKVMHLLRYKFVLAYLTFQHYTEPYQAFFSKNMEGHMESIFH
jgi:hypothetical protein